MKMVEMLQPTYSGEASDVGTFTCFSAHLPPPDPASQIDLIRGALRLDGLSDLIMTRGLQ